MQSTIAMRNDGKLQNDDRVAGKNNIANDWDYSVAANAYVNDTSGNAVYTQHYSKPVDYLGMLRGALKDIAPTVQTTDNPFRVITDKDGNRKVVIDDAMRRNKRSGYSPEQIQAAYNMVMSDPSVQNQLSIEGRYQYRGIPNEALPQYVQSMQDSITKKTNEEIDNIRLGRAMSNDVSEQGAAQAIAALTNNYKASSARLEQMYRLASENPDALKAQLKSEEVNNSFSSLYGYSWDHPSEELVSSHSKLNKIGSKILIEK